MIQTLALMLLLVQGTAVEERGLSAGEFEELHKGLRPPADEGWTGIAWKTSLVQACVQATREKKPLFMVVRSGNPLGCV